MIAVECIPPTTLESGIPVAGSDLRLSLDRHHARSLLCATVESTSHTREGAPRYARQAIPLAERRLRASRAGLTRPGWRPAMCKPSRRLSTLLTAGATKIEHASRLLAFRCRSPEHRWTCQGVGGSSSTEASIWNTPPSGVSRLKSSRRPPSTSCGQNSWSGPLTAGPRLRAGVRAAEASERLSPSSCAAPLERRRRPEAGRRSEGVSPPPQVR